MTIGIFTDTYDPQISGVDTSIKILCRGLKALGHRTVIFTTTDPGAKKQEEDIFRFPSVPFVFLPSRRVAFFIPPRIITRLRSLELDIIHTQTEFSMGYFGKLCAGVLGIPLIHTYHTMYENYTHYVAGGRLISPEVARRVSRVFCNGAAAVTTPTEKMRELLIQYAVRKPVYSIPTGIEFERFKAERYSKDEIAEAKREVGLHPDTPVLINVGRVAKEKGLDEVIRALPMIRKAVPAVKLVSVGDGPYIEELKILAESLGVSGSVIYAGPRPWDVIGKYFRMGDMFVSASTSETQGIVYIEAMASRVPVIVKRDKVVEDIVVDGKTGLFFDTPAELALRAIELLGDANARGRLSENAYAHIQPLSAEVFVGRVMSLYRELIDNNPPRKGIRQRLRIRKRRSTPEDWED